MSYGVDVFAGWEGDVEAAQRHGQAGHGTAFAADGGALTVACVVMHDEGTSRSQAAEEGSFIEIMMIDG